MGAAIVNDLDVADAANALEELLEVLFTHVVGQVADINARGFHRGAVSSSRAFTSAATPLRGAAVGSFDGRPFAGAGVAGVGFGWTAFLLRLGILRLALAAHGWLGFPVEADGLE
jgi:hypothetical protein